MTDKLTRAYRDAVHTALTTITELGKLSGRAGATVRMYLYTERKVSRSAALDMADALEKHAAKIVRKAKKLREVASGEQERKQPPRRRRVRR